MTDRNIKNKSNSLAFGNNEKQFASSWGLCHTYMLWIIQTNFNNEQS